MLQMIFEAAANSGLSQNAMDTFIVDNCKSMYLAGYDTTASSTMWTLMLLAINPQWQAKSRAEVLEICGGQMPEVNMLRNFKIIYTDVSIISIGCAEVGWPGGQQATTCARGARVRGTMGGGGGHRAVALHYDEEIWGSDANIFNPERFANGVNGSCKSPHVYVPFGSGFRICLGQHFSMMELKILLALMLSNFSFSLSPKYNHSPRLKVVMEPKDGVNLIISKL
ncbi:hypothetical protein FEM48_Zijuj10G0041200 [Ziziphus jujuba var. spinosa]|uniref:Cytochrome P450 714C2-like n=1 Tax=Ziziphus jujuba var. spinosa TaxID=714518 RepID=A0A978UL73_ZIZJJ|nr:hypothetical protein FEM48_Zijuj10G0041200 [Ziziphus jujuba var. spinosa]